MRDLPTRAADAEPRRAMLSPPAASASASAYTYSPTEGAASFTYTTPPRGAKAAAAASATEMRVLLALPLDAVSVAMDAKSAGASRLAVGVSKEYAPAGVSPDAPAPPRSLLRAWPHAAPRGRRSTRRWRKSVPSTAAASTRCSPRPRPTQSRS